MPLLLSEAEVATLFESSPPLGWIDLMARTLSDFSRGLVRQPVRSVLRIEEHEAWMGVMPAALPAGPGEGAGLKLVSLVPLNAGRGLHTHLATVLLADPSTGALVAIMDGRLITEKRTAAVTAAAARVLAKPGARTLALLGSGVQAASHLEAFRAVFPLAELRVYSPSAERREAFARRAGALGVPVARACAGAEEAVRGADLVVTVTTSRAPVLRGEWLESGAHVSAVGASTPDFRELDGAAVARCRVWVDSIEAARREAGDLIAAERDGLWSFERVVGEIGGCFAGTVGGRADGAEITLFKSLGLACEDIATAVRLVALARERGVGRTIAL